MLFTLNHKTIFLTLWSGFGSSFPYVGLSALPLLFALFKYVHKSLATRLANMVDGLSEREEKRKQQGFWLTAGHSICSRWSKYHNCLVFSAWMCNGLLLLSLFFTMNTDTACLVCYLLVFIQKGNSHTTATLLLVQTPSKASRGECKYSPMANLVDKRHQDSGSTKL